MAVSWLCHTSPLSLLASIGGLCEEINKTIEVKVQEDLNNLKEHIEKIGVAALGVVDKEAKASALVSSRKRNSWLLFFMAWTLVVSGFVLALAHFKEYVPYFIVYSDSDRL